MKYLIDVLKTLPTASQLHLENLDGHTPYSIITSDLEAKGVYRILENDVIIGFDTETDESGNLHFLQAYSPSQRISYIFNVKTLNRKELTSSMRKWNVVGHNLSFDIGKFFEEDGVYPTPIADTFILACELQENSKGLKSLIKEYFTYDTHDWETIFSEDPNYTDMNDIKWHYVADDPYYTFLLLQKWFECGQLYHVSEAHEIDINVLLPYVLSSVKGMHINLPDFLKLLDTEQQEINILQNELDAFAGWHVNTNATMHLRKLLFGQMGLVPSHITTARGDISVSKESLSFVDDTTGVVEKIFKIKEQKHIVSVLTKLLQETANQDKNNLILHPSYKITGYDGTSRVYSTDPSLSQIPKQLRDAFYPNNGKKYLYMDLKAAEFYILIRWSDCKSLLEVYDSGGDIYMEIAKSLLGSNVTKEDRDKVKVVVLSILYGSDGSSAARTLHIPKEDAKSMVSKFFDTYPKIARFQRLAYHYCSHKGYIKTYYFRPRVLKSNMFDDSDRQRQCVNTAIQGTCADCLKIMIAKQFSENDTGRKPVFVTSVFDSALFEVPEDYTDEEAIIFLNKFISYAAPFNFRYEYGMGKTWGEAQRNMI